MIQDQAKISTPTCLLKLSKRKIDATGYMKRSISAQISRKGMKSLGDVSKALQMIKIKYANQYSKWTQRTINNLGDFNCENYPRYCSFE